MGKKVMLRCIALLLVLVTLSMLVIGCGGDDTKDPDKENPEDTSGTKDSGDDKDTGDDTVDTDVPPVDVIDMGGYEFNALARVTSWFVNEVTAEDETGDLVLQSIYDRNWNIEDRYNCMLTNTLIS